MFFAMVDRRFDRELSSQMGRSGCERLIIGMETMVTRALKTVHKSAQREENIRFLREASAPGWSRGSTSSLTCQRRRLRGARLARGHP